MKPVYISPFWEEPAVALEALLKLEWLQVTEARREYFMSDKPRSYTYGTGDHARTYASNPFVQPVVDILEALNLGDFAHNVCFLNRYDTQKHQLGWHADDSPEMDHEHPIDVVSFGAEREIWWRPNDFKGEIPPEQRQKLASGSLFSMPAGFQKGHQHRIPKCDRSCGIRVSLTFRKYLDRE